MKPSIITNKLINSSDYCQVCHSIHLTAFIHTHKGGTWQSISENDLKGVLDKIKNSLLDEETSGWKKHLDRWEDEGKISKEDRE